MRIAAISDIHSNLAALDAVLEELDRDGIDRIVCLGDIVDLGPLPSATVARVRERCAVCVRGNHDPLDEEPTLPFLREVEEWTATQLSDADRAWLDALPAEASIEVGGHRVRLVHGSPTADTEGITQDTPFADLEAWVDGYDALLAGHTHVQLLRRVEHRSVINVGSVGMPFARVDNGSTPTLYPWAEYAVLEDRGPALGVELRRTPFDMEALREAARSGGMPHADSWLSQWVERGR